MGYYDNEENVEKYIKMAEGFNGKVLVDRLRRYLPSGSSVLEIGMGPGKDLDLLKETYRATGSDSSELFVKRYGALNSGSDLLLLDAVTLSIDRKFDAIYSNKVLQHLSYGQMRESFIRQACLLGPAGLVLHSFWYGTELENYNGLNFYQVTEKKLKSVIGPGFEVLEMERYTEMEDDDSIYGIFRLK